MAFRIAAARKTYHPVVALVLRNHYSRALTVDSPIVVVRLGEAAATEHIVHMGTDLRTASQSLGVNSHGAERLTPPGLTIGSMRVRMTDCVPPKMTWTAYVEGTADKRAMSSVLPIGIIVEDCD